LNIKIVVATHKKYPMPEDDMYLPVHCGKKGGPDLGYQGDDTGDNISEKNSYFCELTATYWAWKNLNADYIGIVHYRRHFSKSRLPFHLLKRKQDCILDRAALERYLEKADVIVPSKRRYWIETNEGHYSHSSRFRPAELKLMRQILREAGDGRAVQAFQTTLNRRWAHMFNMYIMKRELFCEFNQWQFKMLFEFESRLDRSDYPRKENRAWIDELMIDTWLEANRIPYAELPVMFMEKQNWPRKIGGMVLRKIRGSLDEKARVS